MTALYLLSLKRLLKRPGVVLLSIIGIAAGVSLVISVNVVLGSVGRSIDDVSNLSEEATLSVRSRSPLGFPVEFVERVGNDPAVRMAEAQLMTPLVVSGVETMVIGRSDIPSPLGGPALPDGRVVLQSPSGESTIATSPAPQAMANINGGAVLLLPLEQAWEVTGRDGLVDVAPLTLVQSDDGLAARIEQDLGPQIYVTSADSQRQFALQQLEQVQQPMLLMATIALVAGGFLVFNTIQNSARSQARELAVLRALGAGRRQVCGGLLLEAIVLGVVGSAIGVAGGALLGRSIVGVLPDLVDAVAGTSVRFHWDWRVLPGAVLAGLAVAVFSAALPIRALLRSRPDQVLSRRPLATSSTFIRPVAVAIGVVLAIAGLAMSTSTEISIAQNGIGAIFLGMLVLGFGLAGPIARVASSVADQFGSMGSLSSIDIRKSERRVWSVAAAVFVAVGTALSVGGASRNQGDTLNDQFQPAIGVDLWVSAAAADDLPLGFYYPSELIPPLAEIDGVEEARPYLTMFAEADGKQIILLASDHALTAPSLRLAGDEAVQRVVRGEAVVVTILFARAFGVEVGDEVDIPGSTGQIQLPIAAITKATTLSISGAVHLNRQAFVGAFGDPGVNTIEVQTSDGANLETVAAEVRRVLEPSGAPVVVATGQEWFDGVIASTEDAINVFLIVSSAVVAVAGIATLNATVSSVVERRRQLGVLRSIGATPGQVSGLVVIEALSAGLVGALFGGVVGIGMHWLAVYVTTNATPFPQDYYFSWPAVVQALASAAIAVFVGGLIPAIQASRIRIADALAFD